MIAANAFGALLRAHREEAGLSCGELAQATGCDRSLVSRLERDERQPSREMVGYLAHGLALDPVATARLLLSAGYVPDGYRGTLDVVAGVLSDATLSVAERAAFASIVQQLAAHWRAGGAGAERAG